MNDMMLEAMKNSGQILVQRLNLSLEEYLSEGFDVKVTYKDDSGDVYQASDFTPLSAGVGISYKGICGVSLGYTKYLVITFDDFDSYEEFEVYFKKHISMNVSKNIDY
jgi:hypothetical protein